MGCDGRGRLAEIEEFDDADALAMAASARLAAHIGEAIRHNRRVALAVAGGRTPLETYRRLSKCPLRWDWVDLTLTGEPWVSRTSLERNANLLRARLLINEAAVANFIPLIDAWDENPGHVALLNALAKADRAVTALGDLDAVLLGMGPDGHIASIFQDTPATAALLDPESDRRVLLSPPWPGGPRHPRFSLTLATLLKARRLMLVIRGDDKRAAFEQAAAGRLPGSPIAALLDRRGDTVEVLWSR